MKARLALASLMALSLIAAPAFAGKGSTKKASKTSKKSSKKDHASKLGGKIKVEAGISFDESAEEAIVAAVNEARAEEGLSPLAIDPRLREAARVHSKDMADHGFFSHDSPVKGRAKFTDRIKAQGLKKFGSAGENIAAGPFSGSSERASGFMEMWMESEGHRANILDSSFSYIGVGVYVTASGEVYATQEFTKLGSETAIPADPVILPGVEAEVAGEIGLGEEPEVAEVEPEIIIPEIEEEEEGSGPPQRYTPAPKKEKKAPKETKKKKAPKEDYAYEYGSGSQVPSSTLQDLLDELSEPGDDEAGVIIIISPDSGSYGSSKAPSRSYGGCR